MGVKNKFSWAVNVLQNALKRGLTNESRDVEYAFLLVFLQILRMGIGDFPLLSSTYGWKKTDSDLSEKDLLSQARLTATLFGAPLDGWSQTAPRVVLSAGWLAERAGTPPVERV